MQGPKPPPLQISECEGESKPMGKQRYKELVEGKVPEGQRDSGNIRERRGEQYVIARS